MKKTIFALIAVLLSPTGFATQKNIDYCATKDSWVTQRVIDKLKEGQTDLNFSRLSSQVLNVSHLKENGKNIRSKDLGNFYSQTLKITIPYLKEKKPEEVLLVTSIISDEDCSVSQPLIVEVTELGLEK